MILYIGRKSRTLETNPNIKHSNEGRRVRQLQEKLSEDVLVSEMVTKVCANNFCGCLMIILQIPVDN